MLQSRLMRVRCSAMGRFAQNESEMSESNESLGGRGCRTNRELALLRTTRDLTSSHFKHLNKPTVKLGLEHEAMAKLVERELARAGAAQRKARELQRRRHRARVEIKLVPRYVEATDQRLSTSAGNAVERDPDDMDQGIMIRRHDV